MLDKQKNVKLKPRPCSRLSLIFKILSDIQYFRIFRSLFREDQLRATEVAALLNISADCAYKHLKTLERYNLIVKKNGSAVSSYALNRRHSLVTAMKITFFL